MLPVFQQLLHPVILTSRRLAVPVARGKLRGRKLYIVRILALTFVIVGTVKFFLIYRVKMNICDKKIPVYDHFLYGVQRIPEQLLFLLPESICHFHRHLLPVQGRKLNHLFCFPSTGCAFSIRQLLSTEHAISFFIVPVCKNSHDSSSFLFFSFLFF